MLITEPEGRLRRVSRDFQQNPRPIEGVPADILVDGHDGLAGASAVGSATLVGHAVCFAGWKAQGGRIRAVRKGLDGLVYLLNDSPDGALWRLKP